MSRLKVKILDYKPHLVSIELPDFKQFMHISRKAFESNRDAGFYEVLSKYPLPKYS